MSWKRKEFEAQTDFIKNNYIQEEWGWVLSKLWFQAAFLRVGRVVTAGPLYSGAC